MTVCDLKVGQKGIIDNIYGNEKLELQYRIYMPNDR